MTRSIRVQDATFALVRKAFDEKEIVEVTATIAAYNMVSRFLEAIQVDYEEQALPAQNPSRHEARHA